MIERIAFTLYVEPKSLQFGNIRLGTVGGRARIFPNRDAQAKKNAYATLCAPHIPSVPLLGAVHLTLVYVFPRPARFNTKKADPGRIVSVARPDLTNVTKAIEDVFTRAGFWEDDNQVARQTISKFYAAQGEPACIEVTIETIPAVVPQEELFSAR